MKSKYPKLIRRLRREFSWFALACALVAVGYIGYRIFLIAGPNGIAGIVKGEQAEAAVTIGCHHDDTPTDATAASDEYVSTRYQSLIGKQPALGGNLVGNSKFQNVDKNTGNPKGYYHITEDKDSGYALINDADGYFIRATNHRVSTSDELTGGWIMESVPIAKDITYGYGFTYRAWADAEVSLEFIMPDGTSQYQHVTSLPATKEWRQFTAHVVNTREAKAFRFVVVSRKVSTLDTKNYDVHQIADARLPKGVVSVSFDDGWESVYAHAKPLLDKYKIKTTQYIISETAAQDVPEYMNLTQLKELKQEGNEIGSHSIKHCDLTKLDSKDIDTNARASKETLEHSGLGSIDSYAYPYGAFDKSVDTITSKYYSYMRGTNAGYNDRYFDDSNIKAMVVTAKTTDEDFKSWIDYAKANRRWLVIVYHRIDEQGDYSIKSGELAQQLQQIKQSGLDIKPIGQAAKTIHYR